MKKILVLFLSLLLIFSLASCNGAGDMPKKPDDMSQELYGYITSALTTMRAYNKGTKKAEKAIEEIEKTGDKVHRYFDSMNEKLDSMRLNEQYQGYEEILLEEMRSANVLLSIDFFNIGVSNKEAGVYVEKYDTEKAEQFLTELITDEDETSSSE